MKRLFQIFVISKPRKLTIIAVLLITLSLLVYFSMNATGFCWAEKRWLSDDEKIRAAVEYVNKHPQSVYLSGKDAQLFGTTGYEHIPYKNAEDFFEQNLNCCSSQLYTSQILKSRHVDHMVAMLLGKSNHQIKIHYILKYKNPQGGEIKVPYNEYPSSSNCGRILTHYFD